MEITAILNSPTIWETSTSLNEDGLVLAARKGDLEAFNQLVILYQDRIYNLALRILGDEDSAEDITQNTFLNAYRGLHRFRMGPFRSWLYRIATNACYDELRRHTKHPVLSLEYEDEAEERFLPLYDYPVPNNLPEMEVERHELELLVRQSLNRLETNQRAVVVLVDLQNVDYQETAKILGIPIGTVKSRLARGRQRLRYELEASGKFW
jgi:RNA polymerase sigma-70 factor (ECF subfamily)